MLATVSGSAICGLRRAGSASSGRVAAIVAGVRGVRRSGDEGDALVGVEDVAGGGPVVEEADDPPSGVADDPGWGVPELPPEPLRLCRGQRPGEAEELEPADEERCPQTLLAALMAGQQVPTAADLPVAGCSY